MVEVSVVVPHSERTFGNWTFTSEAKVPRECIAVRAVEVSRAAQGVLRLRITIGIGRARLRTSKTDRGTE